MPNVSATCAGSETPEDSTTMASNLRWDARSAMALTRSARSVQHTHPFCSSTSPGSSRSSARVLRTRALSMLSAATSLTTTATRKCPAFSTMRLSSVVLPAPRNPERRVTGIGVCMVMSWLEVVARRGFWGIYQTLCRSSHPRNLPRNVSFHEVRVQMDGRK